MLRISTMFYRFTAAAVAAIVFSISAGCSPEDASKMANDAANNAAATAGDVADAAAGAASDAGAGMSDLMGKATEALASVEGGSDMLKKVSEMFGSATSTLQGVTDVNSATSALPELTKLTDSFGGMTELYGKLPDAAKSAVAGVFQSSLKQLEPIIAQVLAIPGVESVLKPAIDALMSKLSAFQA
jgi:hypothetical protein